MINEVFQVPESGNQEPLVLGPELMHGARSKATDDHPLPAAKIAAPRSVDVSVARSSDHECILFDESHRVSWIIYPPRSGYTFIPRVSSTQTVVEYRVWTPMTPSVYHQLSLATGCVEHGPECVATSAISIATRLGYDPFS
ncbi:MAG: hypothetical protein ACKVVP_21565 [Chloroflexota bacterium]